MDPAIARDWTLWSPLVGRTSMTPIESAVAAVPELTSAILATADGLRICSQGLEDEAQVLDPERGGGLSRMFGPVVSHTVGDAHIVVHSLVVPPFGSCCWGCPPARCSSAR